MKKSIKTLLAIIAMAVVCSFLNACKKDSKPEATIFQEENPLNAFLATTGLNQSAVSFTNPTAFEMGFGFKPKVKGIIKGVTVKLPYVNSSLKVTIWDKASGNPIRSIYVNVPNADQEVSLSIPDLEVAKNAEYVISINSNKFYNHKRSDNAVISYPLDAGNISITGSYTSSTNPVTIPSNTRTTEFTGDYSIIFQQTE